MLRFNAARWLFVILSAAHLIPVWVTPYFVTQDGGSHLENAALLRAYRSSAVRSYFQLNSGPVPNWFGHLAEAALLGVASPRIAEKLLISGYVLLLPWAAWYAVRDAGWSAILVFPLVFNCLLLYGFFNFCWGLCVFLAIAGLWSRQHAPSGRFWIVTALAAVVAYFVHLFAWLTGALFPAVIAVARIRSGRWRMPDAILALTAFAPSATLVALFVVGQGHAAVPVESVRFGVRWSALWHAFTVVWSYAATYAAVSTAFAFVIAALIVFHAARKQWNVWTAMCGAFLAIYFLSPPRWGVGLYVLERWQVLVLLAAALWIAAETRAASQWVLMALPVFAISAALLTLLTRDQILINRELAEYLSVSDAVQPGSTLLPVQFDSRGPGRLRWLLYGMPMRHAAGYLAAERGVIDLDNYEAESGVFPLVFRPEVDPAVFIQHMEDDPPTPDLLAYPSKTGRHIDYVLVWDPYGATRTTLAGQALDRQLQAAYTLIRTSPQAWCRLYRLRS
jgi:hypothetical protein